MAKPIFTNNAGSTLASGISNVDTTLTVATGHGAKFPLPSGGDTFTITIYSGMGVLESNWEILTCTSRSGDVLMVTRGQEGTTAQTWPSAAPVELRLTAATLTALHAPRTASMALATDGNGQIVASSTVSDTELGCLDGVTSSIQTQLNAKQATITGAATSIASSNLTASSALVSDASGKVAALSTVSDTELGYLDGVTSAIQTQINGKQATITGAASTVVSANMTIFRAVVTDGSGKLGTWDTVTTAELDYLDGASSNIQSQLNAKQATITGAATTITGSNLTASMALVSDISGKVANSASTTAAEISYVSGVTSAIQTQLTAKQATITGAATTIVSSNLTASRALVSDASGKVANAAATTLTEIGYVSGVTSAIQTQLNAKQATITGAATTIASADLIATRALVSDASGKVANSVTTATELSYVSGVTSAIQTQLFAKQATIAGAATTITSTDLTASKALVSDASGKVAVLSTVSSTNLGYLNGTTSAIQTQLNARLTLGGGTLAGNLNVPSLNTGPLAGFRNYLINGDFRFWMRGASGFTTSGCSSDRWFYNVNGSTAAITRATGTAPDGFSTVYVYQYATTTQAVGEATFFSQRCEDVYPTAGKSCVLSFWVYASLGFNGTTSYIRVQATQNFGSGGSAQVVTTFGVNYSLSVGWNQIVVLCTIPSTVAKTVGAGNYTAIECIGKAVNAGSISFYEVQLEEGSVATPFEQRPMAIEKTLCERYFEIVPGIFQVPAYADSYYFSTRKRTTPTFSNLTITSGTGGTVTAIDDARGYQNTGHSVISHFTVWATAEL